MLRSPNPFDSLYVSESIDPDSFVTLFSPLLVHDTTPLFRPGNVALVGTQGSGKSMLLSLLKPESRMAFANAGKRFPVDDVGSRFIGAGINLTRSGAIDFGQRTISDDPESDYQETELFFGDFVNYWIVRDLLSSLSVLASSPNSKEFGVDPKALDASAQLLSRSDSWLGALTPVDRFADLELQLAGRLKHYRDFFNYNSDSIPAAVSDSKTSAGEPISAAIQCMREVEAVAEDVELFVRIDQYEELTRLMEWLGPGAGEGFTAVIHKMLGLRDPRVSYRIGTRKNAWPDNPRMQGTAAVLEELRNYTLIDLDRIIGAKEHSKPFGKFAEDVFERRIAWAGYSYDKKTPALRYVFGNGLSPEEEAKHYASSSEYRPKARDEWPSEVNEALRSLASARPLSACLGEAFLLQKGFDQMPLDPGANLPWETDAKKWWVKERRDQALLQLAARKQQQMIWAGRDDIIALSGKNILVFVSLCQAVWDSWLRGLSPTEMQPPSLPQIWNVRVQNDGIQSASHYWYRKIRSDPGGERRQRFVNVVGTKYRRKLRSDERMSYPGHNGFSIELQDLESTSEVESFLREASSYGVLVDTVHSTRAKSGRKRRKWYLAQIYSPHFQIPAAHTKEPDYVSATVVGGWIEDAETGRAAPDESDIRQSPSPGQTALFE